MLKERKQCTKCKQTKNIDEFWFKDKKKGKRSSWCTHCFKEYKQKVYPTNASYYIQYAKKRNSKVYYILREFLWGYLKDHPCIDCGEDDPIVLEFDHKIKEDKKASISDMIKNYCSIESLVTEINKCEVRCANCHRRKTAKERGWYKYIRDDGEL